MYVIYFQIRLKSSAYKELYKVYVCTLYINQKYIIQRKSGYIKFLFSSMCSIFVISMRCHTYSLIIRQINLSLSEPNTCS